MARIPDRIQISPQRNVSLPAGSVYGGDLGLSDLGRGLAEAAETRQTEAATEAKVASAGALEETNTTVAALEQTWDQRTPGYAQAAVKAYDENWRKRRETLSDDGKRAGDRAQLEDRLRFVDQVQSHEANVLGSRKRELTRTIENTEAFGIATKGWALTGQDLKRLQDAFRPQDPGADLMTPVVEAIARGRKAVVDAAPAHLRDLVGAQFDNYAAGGVLAAGKQEEDAREAYQKFQAVEAMSGLSMLVRQGTTPLDEALGKLDELHAHTDPKFRFPALAQDRNRLAADWYRANFVDKGDFAGALADIKAGKSLASRTLTDDARARFQDELTTRAQSDATQLNDHNQTRALADAVRNIQLGVPTDYDPAKAYPNDPLKRQMAEEALVEARQDRFLTHDIPNMSSRDWATYQEKNRPTEKSTPKQRQLWELALKAREEGNKALIADPPGAIMSNNPQIRESWTNATRAGAANSARVTYAKDTLAAQENAEVPERARQILPAGVARQYATSVKKPGQPGYANTLQQIRAYAESWDEFDGQVLTEIGRAGLSSKELAMIAMPSGIDLIDQFAYAAAIAPTVHPSTAILNQTKDLLHEGLTPLARTFRQFGAEGATMAEGMEQGALDFALEGLNNGLDPKEAAAAAIKKFTKPYAIGGTWRLPERYNHQWGGVLAMPTQDETMLGQGGVAARFPELPIEREADGVSTFRLGLYRLKKDHIKGQYGRSLQTGAYLKGAGSQPYNESLTADAANTGEWYTNDTDTAVTLYIEDPSGGLMAVLDANGKPVTYTIPQVIERTALPTDEPKAAPKRPPAPPPGPGPGTSMRVPIAPARPPEPGTSMRVPISPAPKPKAKPKPKPAPPREPGTYQRVPISPPRKR